MNINLGTPYEDAIERIIKKGYAGNQTEVIRQALLAYERALEEEEMMLVQRGVESMMSDIRAGKVKTYTLDEVKKNLKKK